MSHQQIKTHAQVLPSQMLSNAASKLCILWVAFPRDEDDDGDSQKVVAERVVRFGLLTDRDAEPPGIYQSHHDR